MNHIDTPQWGELLDGFLKRHQKSAAVYKSEVNQFFKWYGGALADLTAADIEAYRDHLSGRVSAGTIARKVSTVNRFLKYAEKKAKGFKSPIGRSYGDLQKYQSAHYLDSDAFKRHFDGWRRELAGKQKRAENTIRTYTGHVRDFLQWAKKPPQDLRQADFESYRDHLGGKNLSPATIWGRFLGLNSFLKHIENRKTPNRLDIKGLAMKRMPKGQGLKNVLTPKEVKDLLRQPDRRRLIGKRDYLALRLMLDWGLRAGEVCKMRFKDLVGPRVKVRGGYSQKAIIRNRKGKGVDTDIYLSGEMLKALDDWMTASRIRFAADSPILAGLTWSQEDEGLVINWRRVRERKPLTIKTVENTVARHIKTAGIKPGDRKLTPHALRHTCFTQMAARGQGPEVIKSIAGHQDVATTMLYLDDRQSHESNVGLIDLYSEK